ncbi:PLP-dependent transferase, partial [Staphylococcus epidermidis]|uniref:PLP-dependent transferase n=1 Tax=Staphylococcus epidermidis TaxID=1282 RepID=UPI001642DD66
QSTPYHYTPTKNPTTTPFQEPFPQLQKPIPSFPTSTRMPTIHLISNIFKPPHQILLPFHLYPPTFPLFHFYQKQYPFNFKYLHFLNYQQLQKNITPQTTPLFI